jgi:Tol biopolymer transport system component
MTLAAGTKLGPYEILAPIGAGGMGEVYRANDTRLDRPVAVKVLAPGLAATAEVRQRFEREARTISKLSHAHICALYDVGRQGDIEYLVMELLEGESLAERLARGPLSLEQTLRYGGQIADALDKAHRQGVIHRDLKPGNVMLTKSGVKLLDFGLAKTLEAPAPQSSASVLPTQVSPVTQAGTVLGTFQYMAPEQLEGKEADARTDIFALGAVLYEMATGRKAFAGSSQASLIAAILQSDPPPISSVQPLAPPTLDRVARACLAKDPEDRTQSAHDVAAELRWIGESSQSGAGAPVTSSRPRRTGREAIAWIVAAIAVAGLAWALLSARPPATVDRRLEVALLPADGTSGWGPIALSRDGSQLAYVAVGADGRRRLYVRALNRLEARVLPGTEHAKYPFWSPDGRSLGFFDDASMNRIDLAGGPPRRLAPVADPRGGTWNAEGTIVFVPSPGVGLLRMPASGGAASPLTTLDSKRQETSHRWPNFLPDGKHVLMLVRRPGDPERLVVDVVSLPDGKRHRVLEADSSAEYSNGRIFFLRGTTLFAQPFDAEALKTAGEASPVADKVWRDPQMDGLTAFSVASGGEVAYRGGGLALTQVSWFDRSGRKLRSIGSPGVYSRPRLAPDGRRYIIDVTDIGKSNSYIQVFDEESRSTMTFGEWNDSQASWAPDGTRIAYSSDRNGPFDIFVKDAVGGGAEKPLIENANWKYPESWSKDGRWLLYREIDPKTKGDLWILPMTGPGGKATPFLTTPADEREPEFSPDGRFVAYISDESGESQVYVQPNPPTGAKWRVSRTGGMWPRWRADGRELFFVQNGSRLVAVEVATEGSTLRIGRSQELFFVPLRLVNASGGEYDVSNDGTRFLINEAVGVEITSPVNLVLGGLSPGK